MNIDFTMILQIVLISIILLGYSNLVMPKLWLKLKKQLFILVVVDYLYELTRKVIICINDLRVYQKYEMWRYIEKRKYSL